MQYQAESADVLLAAEILVPRGTATARVGYAWGRTLLYGKGGAAFEDSRISATCFNPQGGALGVPNLCTNQAGVVFANGTGFGTSARSRPCTMAKRL